jgi:hypothetical protein
MSKRKIVVIGSIASLLLVGGLSSALVQASVQETKIYGCVTAVNGNITQVKMIPHSCPPRTTPIEWSVSGSQTSQGPKGDTGEQGPAGEPGAQGPRGEKGEPGYSYEEALASVDDADSNVHSVMFGGDGCLGPNFIRYAGDTFKGTGSESICARTIHNLASLKVLSVKSAPSVGRNPDAMKIYLAPGGCPNTFESLKMLKTERNLKGYLIHNALPFKWGNSSEVSCLFMFAYGDEGMYQVVYSTN